MGVLPSVQRWQELREIRNRFAHDYQDDEMKAVVLNAACSGIEEMAEVLDRVGKASAVELPSFELFSRLSRVVSKVGEEKIYRK